MHPDDRARLQAWVRAYVAEAVHEDRADAFVTQVDTEILAALPELAADPVLVTALHASTRSQYQVFMSVLEREHPELLLPPQAVDLALSLARRQMDLGVLLKIYRIAAESVWRWFTDVVAAVPDDGPDRTQVLMYLWDHGGTWINLATEQLIGVYSAERDASVQGALARRTDMVQALLRGDPVPTDEAARALGHPVRLRQTALVLWSSGSAPQSALAEASAALAAACDATALTVPASSGELWCWLATPADPSPEALARAASALPAAGHVRVAAGLPAAGVDGFRESHREAVAAQRHALATGDLAGLTAYGDVELACLAAGNEAAARAFVTREIGPLVGAGLERLRETISIFLRHGGNVERTAATLHLHKNSVRYRLAQAEELLGHPLSERRTEIALALDLLPRYAAR